jgi:hypothetical protein
MSTACLFIAWNHPYPKMHKEAFGFLTSQGLEMVAKWKKEGWFKEYELIGITPHCGQINGFMLFKGERPKLDELRRTDDFEKFAMQMASMFEGFGVVPGVTEAGIRKVMERNPDFMK